MISNPLRYPGSKSKLYNYMVSLLKQEELLGCTFYEPFAGSASLSLSLLENDVVKKAVINERDPLIYSFWDSVFHYTDELIQSIEDTPITLETWYSISEYRNSEYLVGKTPVEKGFAGLFLNRTNFSGILKANPLGGKKQTSQYKIDCRFNKDRIIKSIISLSKFRDRIDIYGDDAIYFMESKLKYKRHNSYFVYIDPPYYKAGPELYRYYYRKDDHETLADYIKKKSFNWLISYDDTPEIRKLYHSSQFINLYLDYSVRTSKKGAEILISNLKIPPLTQEELDLQFEIDLA